VGTEGFFGPLDFSLYLPIVDHADNAGPVHKLIGQASRNSGGNAQRLVDANPWGQSPARQALAVWMLTSN
jgi:hypothetical protein